MPARKKTAYKTPLTPPPSATTGFGFAPEVSGHHFMVRLEKDHALISEHLHHDPSPARREVSLALGREDDKLRVILPLTKWTAIAEPVREVFNDRLRTHGYKPGRWLKTGTAVSRLLGKELVLLAWAIEDADPALIPTALINWRGLAPEERWWLYTMTHAATGHATAGRGKGWRKALRYALTENPTGDPDAIDAAHSIFRLQGDSVLREGGSIL